VIEVDGDTHADAMERDTARTAVIEAEGYRVVRFTNGDVMDNLDGVLSSVASMLADTGKGSTT